MDGNERHDSRERRRETAVKRLEAALGRNFANDFRYGRTGDRHTSAHHLDRVRRDLSDECCRGCGAAAIHRLHCVDFVVGRRELQEVHVARAGDSARGEYTYAGGSISRPETAPALRRYDAPHETEKPEAIRISRLLREAHTLKRRDDGFARDAADAAGHHRLPGS